MKELLGENICKLRGIIHMGIIIVILDYFFKMMALVSFKTLVLECWYGIAEQEAFFPVLPLAFFKGLNSYKKGGHHFSRSVQQLPRVLQHLS